MDIKQFRVGNHIEIKNTGVELLSMAMTELSGDTDKWVRTIVDLQLLEALAKDSRAWEYRRIALNSNELECLGWKHITGDAVWEDYKLSDYKEIWHCGNGYFIVWDSENYVLYQHSDEDTYNQLKWIYTVDELQNLYFFLEDEELNYTPPPVPVVEPEVISEKKSYHDCRRRGCNAVQSITVTSTLKTDGVYVTISPCKKCDYQYEIETLFPKFK